MKLHYLQHVPFEGLGSISDWAARNNYSITSTELFSSQELPNTSDIDLLVVMGGPMNIYEYDKYPWLVKEKAFIKEYIASGKPLVGVCLGAQLIADTLGARVAPGEEKEIGWFPIIKTEEASSMTLLSELPCQLTAFHWHGDTFDIPSGAIKLFSSDACPNQAFVYNDTVLALQFHLETTTQSVRALVDNCGAEIVSARYIQTPQEIIGTPEQFLSANDYMCELLSSLVS